MVKMTEKHYAQIAECVACCSSPASAESGNGMMDTCADNKVFPFVTHTIIGANPVNPVPNVSSLIKHGPVNCTLHVLEVSKAGANNQCVDTKLL